MSVNAAYRSHLVILAFTNDSFGACYYTHIWDEKTLQKNKSQPQKKHVLDTVILINDAISRWKLEVFFKSLYTCNIRDVQF